MASNFTPNLPDVILPSLQSAQSQHLQDQKEAGPSELPPELQRQIFEICALDHDYPRICTNLVLVSKAVYAWIDPILLSTVCITEDFRSRRQGKFKSFLAKLTSGKNPVEYYARHVKNLAFFGGFSYSQKEIDGILAICTGVENLAIKAEVERLNFFYNPKAGTALRRLYIDYWNHRTLPSDRSLHACFRNLTHLHLADMDQAWPYYTGWEHLTHLTHLAFERSSSDKLGSVIQVLPAIRYVALGFYYANHQFLLHNDVVVDNSPYVNTAWAVRVVLLGGIPPFDWERGAWGKGDFWDVVEDEVERRLREGLS